MLSDTLGLKQQQAVDGPNGPAMKQFTCAVCEQRYFDTKYYFYDVESTRCLWCIKYGKSKKVPKLAEANNE
jgi:hypothetical protein